MIQAFYKIGLCALGALGTPLPVQSEPAAEPLRLQLENEGPGILSVQLEDGWETLEPDSSRILEVSAETDIRIEAAAAENAVLESLQINGEPQLPAVFQTEYQMQVELRKETSVHACFIADPDEAEPSKTSSDLSVMDSQLPAAETDEEAARSDFDSDPEDEQDPLAAAGLLAGSLLARSALNSDSLSRERAAGSSLQVTDRAHYAKVSVFQGAGTVSNYLWTLSNGQHAFCARFINASPEVGADSVSVEEVSSPELRKVLYYGFNGPGNLLGELGFSQPQQVVLTNDLVSQAYSGICISKDEPGIDFWTGRLDSVWARIQAQPDPENYRAYVANFPGRGVNHRNTEQPYQPLAFGLNAPKPSEPVQPGKGAIRLLKSMKNPTLSSTGAGNYSLQGAIYGLYADAGCTRLIGELCIDARDESQVLETDPGTYWLRELKAPRGYALSQEITRVEVPEGSSVQSPHRVIVYDSPQYAPIDLLVQKIDAVSGRPSPALAGAVFKISYYSVDPKAYQSALPQRELRGVWMMRTDANGQIRCDSSFFESDTDLIRVGKQAVFPIGVVTIQEVEPPEGYMLNDTLYRVPIDPSGSNQEVLRPFQAPSVPDRPLRIQIYKEDGKTQAPLGGAEFTLKSPSGKSSVLTSDANGQTEAVLDENGIWSLQETRAPAGYQINARTVRIEASAEGIETNCPAQGDSITFTGTSLRIQDLSDCWALKIRKVDQQGQPLAGATFALYTDAALQDRVSEQTTEIDGTAVFSNLSEGYVLAELEAPEHCRLPLDEQGKPLSWRIAARKKTDGSMRFQIRGAQSTGWIEAGQSAENWTVEKDGDLSVLVCTITNERELQSPDRLPQTGGRGALLCLAGAGLLSGVGCLLERKRRDFSA